MVGFQYDFAQMVGEHRRRKVLNIGVGWEEVKNIRGRGQVAQTF